MFKDTSDGQTYFCTHRDDHDVVKCDICLPKNKPQRACACIGPRGRNKTLCEKCEKASADLSRPVEDRIVEDFDIKFPRDAAFIHGISLSEVKDFILSAISTAIALKGKGILETLKKDMILALPELESDEYDQGLKDARENALRIVSSFIKSKVEQPPSIETGYTD